MVSVTFPIEICSTHKTLFYIFIVMQELMLMRASKRMKIGMILVRTKTRLTLPIDMLPKEILPHLQITTSLKNRTK